MPQFARPISTITAGGWTDNAGGTALAAAVDEAVSDAADYIIGAPNVPGDSVELLFSSTIDPVSSTGHVVRYKAYRAGPERMDLTVGLWQGTTRKAVWIERDIPSGETLFEHTLTTAETNSISNYGDLRLRFIQHPAYTWTDLGQDTVIAAEPTAAARNVFSVLMWANRIWEFYGDVNDISAFTKLRYYDLSNNTFNTVAGAALGEDSDRIEGTIINDRLMVMYNDPGTNTGDYGYVPVDTLTAVHPPMVAPGTLEHGWDMHLFKDALIYAGAVSGVAGKEQTVFRSTDFGKSWSTVLQPTPGTGHWFCVLWERGGTIYTIAYDAASNDVSPTYSSTDGVNWSSTANDIGPAGTYPFQAETFAGYAFIRSGGFQARSGYILRFDGTFPPTNVGAATGGFNVSDICVAADGLYLLTRSTEIWRTQDGVNWKLVQNAPSPIYSIDVVEGVIYAGTSNTDGTHLWMGTPIDAYQGPNAVVDAGGAYMVDEDGNVITAD